MGTLITYRLEGTVATITWDDGKRNVVSPELVGELGAALERAAQDRAVVLLTGREGVFSAGFDLNVLKAGGARAAELLCGGLELAQKIFSLPVPVLIACNGHALAMGSFLLLSADYRIGAAGAFKFGANEVAIGMTVPRSAIEICRQRLVPAYFQRAVMLAEIYAPDSAVAAGFLDRVVPAADLLPTAQAMASEFAKLDILAHAATKQRARAQALQQIRAAFEADAAEYRTRV
jgi:enoyl-CoA hydratase